MCALPRVTLVVSDWAVVNLISLHMTIDGDDDHDHDDDDAEQTDEKTCTRYHDDLR